MESDCLHYQKPPKDNIHTYYLMKKRKKKKERRIEGKKEKNE